MHNAAGMEIKLSKNNDHDGVSHGVECRQEGDRIPPLKSNRQALEQEHRLSCVLRDCSGASTDFLDQLYGRLVPGTGSFNCHWQKDVRGRQRAIYLTIFFSAALFAAEHAPLLLLLLLLLLITDGDYQEFACGADVAVRSYCLLDPVRTTSHH